MDESSLGTVSFAVAIFVIMLFAFGLVVGERIGEEMGGKCVEKREFHVANLKILATGILASAVVWAVQLLTLAGLVFGLMVGALAGARLGFGGSVGPWKFADKYFNVNKSRGGRREDEKARARAARKARKEGKPEPEFMSVQTDGTNPAGDASAKKGAKH
ncbi:MAG: hypothetical protein LKI67_05240 [Olsenella sp.]|jgi:hypothetical protein|nr:hypothetical protein [Olsenella sp.]MCI1792446.1 hypothetical protein [Olsenella sp.]MCI1811243.1 hypothetical protein [Olsenella sp.]MCI1879755.1 hypothetical protein [Olsenella sp.]